MCLVVLSAPKGTERASRRRRVSATRPSVHSGLSPSHDLKRPILFWLGRAIRGQPGACEVEAAGCQDRREKGQEGCDQGHEDHLDRVVRQNLTPPVWFPESAVRVGRLHRRDERRRSGDSHREKCPCARPAAHPAGHENAGWSRNTTGPDGPVAWNAGLGAGVPGGTRHEGWGALGRARLGAPRVPVWRPAFPVVPGHWAGLHFTGSGVQVGAWAEGVQRRGAPRAGWR